MHIDVEFHITSLSKQRWGGINFVVVVVAVAAAYTRVLLCSLL